MPVSKLCILRAKSTVIHKLPLTCLVNCWEYVFFFWRGLYDLADRTSITFQLSCALRLLLSLTAEFSKYTGSKIPFELAVKIMSQTTCRELQRRMIFQMLIARVHSPVFCRWRRRKRMCRSKLWKWGKRMFCSAKVWIHTLQTLGQICASAYHTFPVSSEDICNLIYRFPVSAWPALFKTSLLFPDTSLYSSTRHLVSICSQPQKSRKIKLELSVSNSRDRNPKSNNNLLTA